MTSYRSSPGPDALTPAKNAILRLRATWCHSTTQMQQEGLRRCIYIVQCSYLLQTLKMHMQQQASLGPERQWHEEFA